VDLFLKEGHTAYAACGRCISFFCVASGTNIATIFQNDVRCISFEQNGATEYSACEGLSIETYSVMPDSSNPFLTTFVIEGDQCFQGGINEVTIECVDALQNSNTSELRVDSVAVCEALCQNCPNCIEKEDVMNIAAQISLQCPGFENLSSITVQKAEEPANYDSNVEIQYCTCETNQNDTFIVSEFNQCGETANITLIASCKDKVFEKKNAGMGVSWTIELAVVLATISCFINHAIV
jgi:hypothetical protein